MALSIYSTLSRTLAPFAPIEPNHVRMYVCGVTVYDYCHIGHGRTFVAFDVVRRWLEASGMKVTFVRNITDVDDKIIRRAAERGITTTELTEEFGRAMQEDMLALGCLAPTHEPRATDYIPEMLGLIEKLEQKGYAYQGSDGDVDFAVRKFENYGRLSGKSIDDLQSGARVDVAAGKRDPLDFVLWKSAKPGEPQWESKWGCGRPGWHIECSAMSRKYLGLPFDIHGGGGDLVFPHHENERAQSEAACGCTFANHWMHGGMLQINSEKMSKSLGNFKLLREVLETTRPEVLRFLMLQTHYRSPLDFSADRLDEAASALGRIENAVKNLDWLLANAEDIPSPLDLRALMDRTRQAKMGFILAMDDDFNTCKALGEVFDFIADVNAQTAGKTLSLSDVPPVRDARALIVELMGVFGIDVEAAADAADEASAYPAEVVALAADIAGYEGSDAAEAVDALLAARADARAAKDWARADAVRDGLCGLGFTIEDTPQGARVTYEG